MIYIFSVVFLLMWVIVLNKTHQFKLNSLILVFFIFVIFCSNRQNQDYDAYVDIFNENELYAEVGYRWLIYFVRWIGGSHNTIICILGFLVGATIYRICRLTKYGSYFAILYLLCPMPVDIVQIRNSFLLMFFINALIELSLNNRVRSLIYISFVVLFHSLGVVYFAIWCVVHFRKWRLYNRLIAIGSVISFLIVPFIIGFLIRFFDTRTLSEYISTSVKFHSLIVWGGPYYLDLILILYLKRKIIIPKEDVISTVGVFISALTFISVFSPLLLYLDEINRIFRNAMVLKYAIFVWVMPYVSRKVKYLLFVYLMLIALLLSIYYTHQLDYDYIVFGF